ncbi:hypothetical protein NSS91_15950 [Caldifermentibacillus hisashii]|uniref:hypothetical protein n=1 Tax=Caldifermentibacillus hisashii TaxID=996558 RepID=UPI0031FBCBAA
MKQVVDRELIKVRGKIVELYKMDDDTYRAFAIENFDTDDEIVGIGEGDEKETAIKLALQDLYIETKKWIYKIILNML